ncbi:MAG: hypothetical protein HYX66_05260 [Ignavibacteria bacterium]|nr:hypothetical protein [Ignavibacteria bacterium]
MKTLIVTIANILAVASALSQQYVSRIDNYSFGGYTITDVEYNAPYLFICGDQATIMYSELTNPDFKKAFTDVGDSVLLNDIEFGPASMGLCVGSDGTILRSSNGGQTWAGISTGTFEHFYGVAISPSGNDAICVGTGGIAMKSGDGGATWQTTNTGTKLTLYDVTILPGGAFLAVGEGGYIATLASGSSTWQVRSGSSSRTFYSCLFTSAQNGWVGINGGILRTEDGGVTWTQQLSGVYGSIMNIDRDANTLVAAGSAYGTIGVSQDGSTWQQVYVGDTVATKGVLYSSVISAAVVTGEDGMVRVLELGPALISEIGAYNAPFYFDHLKLGDGTLWCVGSNGAVHSRSSAGEWIKHTTGSTALLTGIASNIDGSILCVSGADGVVLRSSDGGSTWNSISLPNQTPLSSISFNGSFWAAGREKVYVSSDGSSWSQAGSVTGTRLLDVEAVSSNEAYVCGTGGIISRTTDGGSTWTLLTTNVTSTFMDGDIDASGIGLFVGQFGLGLLTTDGGSTFLPLTIPESSIMITAVDADASTGRAAITTISGKIIYRASPTSQWAVFDGATQFSDVALTADEITAVGEGGTVIRVPLSAVSVEEAPLQHALLITPNPANESIEVILDEAEKARNDGYQLVVTSIEGKVVKKNRFEPGRSRLTFDVSRLPIGVYSISAFDKEGIPIGSGLVTLSR